MKLVCLLLFLSANITLYAKTDSLPSKVYHVSELPVIKDSSRYRIQIMDGATPYLTNLEVHITILDPGKAAHPPHVHDSTEELIIVKEGKIRVTIAGRTKIINTGGVAMAMPGDLHETVNAGTEKATYYLLKYTKHKSDLSIATASLMVDWNEVKVEKTDRGFRRQQFNQPTVLFEQFDMHATTLNQGQVSHAPHTHIQEEIIIVRKGNIEMQIGNTFTKAIPGDLIFLNSQVSHALKNISNGTREYFAFQWK
ncbi:MAG: cupin domain-containing protein [Agriterribacter sp.]